jgi:tetratricopeptide (TPR) repeat protein
MRRYLGERPEELAQLLIRAASLAASDETKGDVLTEHAGLLIDRGKYQEAENLIRQALALTKVTDPSYGTVLHSLAKVRSLQGQYGEAETLFRQVLTLQEKVLGVANPGYGTALQDLSVALMRQGQHGEAESLLRQALALFEKSLGVAHPSYGVALDDLSLVLLGQGKDGEAEFLLRQSLALKEKTLDLMHPSLGPTLCSLANSLNAQGRLTEVEPLLQRALTIARTAMGGPLNPDVAEILNLLAQAQAALGRSEAQETARQALTALNTTLGFGHPLIQLVGPELERIADGATASMSRACFEARAAAERGDLATAVAAQEEAVALARDAGAYPLVGLSVLLFNLASFYGRAERYEDAVRALEEVVALDKRTGHPALESDRQALEEARRRAELTPEERKALQACAAAMAIRDQVIAALRQGTDRTGLAAGADEAAEQVAAAAEAGAPERELASYLRAVAAVLRGEPAPEVPPGFAEPLTAIIAAIQEGSP